MVQLNRSEGDSYFNQQPPAENNAQGGESANARLFQDTISSAATNSAPVETGYNASFDSRYQDTMSSAAAAAEDRSEANNPEKKKEPARPSRFKGYASRFLESLSNVVTSGSKTPPSTESVAPPSNTAVNNNVEKMEAGSKEVCVQSKKIKELDDKICNLLQQENPNMRELDSLLRDLFFRILKKMLLSEHKISMDELQLLEEDIKKIRGTYNTVQEMFLGIAGGALNIFAGVGQMGGALASITGSVSENVLKQVNNFANGASAVSRGIDPIQGMVRSANESKRVSLNYHKERDSGFKSATDAAMQALRAIMNSQKSQSSSAIDAWHQAFLRMSIMS